MFFFKVISFLISTTIILSINTTPCDAGSNPESQKWLTENSQKEGVITLPSGLQYKVLKEGTGDSHPTISSSTECHYEGKLITGDVFDSSYARGSPTAFAPNQVIKGWTEAMQLMVEGDKWELYIPSDLGYGDRGSPPKIGGGDALIFVMEMIKIQGDKVPAVKCNVETLEKCNDKQKKYVENAKSKFDTVDLIQTEIDRIQKVSAKVSDSAKSWANVRVKILSALKKLIASDGDTSNKEL